jgi:hypothetical protein
MRKSDSSPESNFFTENWKTATRKDKPASQDYVPLPIQNLIPGQEVFFEILVRITGTGQTGDRFKTRCPSGQTFEPVWLTKLWDAGINRVYFHQQDQALVFKSLNQGLPEVLNDDSLSVMEKSERVADVTYFWVNQFFTNTQI